MKVLLADKLSPIVVEYLIANGHEVHSDPSLKEDPLLNALTIVRGFHIQLIMEA